MKNRYCEGEACPKGLCFAIRSLRKKKLTEQYCGMKEKSKAKSLNKWKLIPDRKPGAIYTPLTCGFGSFKDAKMSGLRAYLNQWRETLKLTD